MRSLTVLAIALLLTMGTAQMRANTIALEGSDATAFHHEGTYTTQLFTFLQAGSAKKVLVLGGVPLSGAVGQYDLNPDYSLATALVTFGTTIVDYSAVYVESVGGCCTQADHSISAADQVTIGAAEALGLNLSIENYGGGPAWGPMLPAAVDALPSSDFGGITDFGTAGGPGCTDGEVFNANGLSKGFTQPPVLGCYEHQAYFLPDFAALGFISLVDADPAFFGLDASGKPKGSALLALGGALGTPAGVPEPASILLFGSVVTALAGVYRKKLRAQ